MRFFSNIFAGAALVAAAVGLEFNAGPVNVQVGNSYTYKYSPAEQATVVLRKGPGQNSAVIGTLGTATGGTFTWSVDKSLVNGNDYALEIKNSNGDNFWGPIAVAGSAATASASGASSSAAASSSAPASSGSSSASASASASASVTITTSASASVSPSTHGNSTISSATLTPSGSTKPSGSPSSTASGGVPNSSTGASSSLGSSPMALIFGAVAAIAYLN